MATSLETALQQERADNARLFNRVRFAGVSTFYALFLVLGWVMDLPAWQGNLGAFTVYWLASFAIFWAARNDTRIANMASISIAVLDIPAIFMLQLAQFPASNPGGVAGFNVGVYAFLLLLGMLSLDRKQIFITAAVAILFEGTLQYLANIGPGAIVASALLLSFCALVCAYASTRLRDLVIAQVQAQERRGKLERLASIGQISGSIGHDLRNPLTIISLAAEQLGMLIPTRTADAEQALATIEQEIRMCTSITERLLDFGSERPLKLKPTELQPLLTEVQGVVAMKVPAHVRLHVAAEAGLPPVKIDRDLFRQTLVNLVSNALEAIAPETPEGHVSLTAAREGGGVVVKVKDNGSGIPQELHARIFDPLFTTKATGNGFGLAIANNIVTRMGAELLLDSAVGQGTVFTVRFS